MTTTFAFTEARVRALNPPADKEREYHKDATLPGLQVCVFGTGVKVFYFVKRMDGKPTRVRLGTVAQLSVDQARKAAAKFVGRVAEGGNPQEEHRAKRQEPTLGALFAHWLEAHSKPRKRTWREDERKFTKYVPTHWHGRKLSAIRVVDVVAWHQKIGREHGRYQANRCLELLTTLYSKAFEVGYIGPNPCKAVAAFPEESRERYLLPNEMQAFFAALAAQEEIWQHFFLLCLFTGARRGNVASMRWEEIDLPGGVWRIPASKFKNGRPAVVALSPPAITILETRLQGANGSEWVFPSGRSHNHVVDPRKAWARILAASKITDLRMHDLRRSLGSWQAALGSSLLVIGKSLGHADLKSTQVYSRLQLEPIRESISKAADAMMIAGGVKLLEAHSARHTEGRTDEAEN
jgi:integrase